MQYPFLSLTYSWILFFFLLHVLGYFTSFSFTSWILYFFLLHVLDTLLLFPIYILDSGYYTFSPPRLGYYAHLSYTSWILFYFLLHVIDTILFLELGGIFPHPLFLEVFKYFLRFCYIS